MSTDAALFGTGVAFPPRLDAEGRWGWAVGDESVRQSIRIILTTEPGERLMLPSFGAGLRAYLFEPNIPSTHRHLEERIGFALRRWEPRITVSSVAVGASPDDPSSAVATVSYSLVATGTTEALELAIPVRGGASP
ncbi:GPW/gp25 family protein [Humibacillus xanthopallidus]|nr:GPW/gp25 family protein [Humibacillus xanthopallidus]